MRVNYSQTLPCIQQVQALSQGRLLLRLKAAALAPLAGIVLPFGDASVHAGLAVAKIPLLVKPLSMGRLVGQPFLSQLDPRSPRLAILSQIAFHVVRCLASLTLAAFATITIPFIILMPRLVCRTHDRLGLNHQFKSAYSPAANRAIPVKYPIVLAPLAQPSKILNPIRIELPLPKTPVQIASPIPVQGIKSVPINPVLLPPQRTAIPLPTPQSKAFTPFMLPIQKTSGSVPRPLQIPDKIVLVPSAPASVAPPKQVPATTAVPAVLNLRAVLSVQPPQHAPAISTPPIVLSVQRPQHVPTTAAVPAVSTTPAVLPQEQTGATLPTQPAIPILSAAAIGDKRVVVTVPPKDRDQERRNRRRERDGAKRQRDLEALKNPSLADTKSKEKTPLLPQASVDPSIQKPDVSVKRTERERAAAERMATVAALKTGSAANEIVSESASVPKSVSKETSVLPDPLPTHSEIAVVPVAVVVQTDAKQLIEETAHSLMDASEPVSSQRLETQQSIKTDKQLAREKAAEQRKSQLQELKRPKQAVPAAAENIDPQANSDKHSQRELAAKQRQAEVAKLKQRPAGQPSSESIH